VCEIKGIKNRLYFGCIFNKGFVERSGYTGLKLFKEKRWMLNSRMVYDYIRKDVLA
jgi:hypothetical protein